uniref:Uncharacterized protein n=1 Tax=Timema monikensis TaxID=170555 RepID=A0A7R9E254_9NEOP|nr:unnamed protein product [Timema monikensis]
MKREGEVITTLSWNYYFHSSESPHNHKARQDETDVFVCAHAAGEYKCDDTTSSRFLCNTAITIAEPVLLRRRDGLVDVIYLTGLEPQTFPLPPFLAIRLRNGPAIISMPSLDESKLDHYAKVTDSWVYLYSDYLMPILGRVFGGSGMYLEVGEDLKDRGEDESTDLRALDIKKKDVLFSMDTIDFMKKCRLWDEKQIDFAEQVESVAYVLCGESPITLDKFCQIFKAKGAAVKCDWFVRPATRSADTSARYRAFVIGAAWHLGGTECPCSTL